MNNVTMRNDKLLQKRFNVLKMEADKKYADDPVMAKQVKGTLSATGLVISGLWAEFYEEFKYDSPWIMSSMGNSTQFIKSFSNKHLNVALQDLPNDVITLFVISSFVYPVNSVNSFDISVILNCEFKIYLAYLTV